jgi:hypothetical protein
LVQFLEFECEGHKIGFHGGVLEFFDSARDTPLWLVQRVPMTKQDYVLLTKKQGAIQGSPFRKPKIQAHLVGPELLAILFSTNNRVRHLRIMRNTYLKTTIFSKSCTREPVDIKNVPSNSICSLWREGGF